MVSVDVPISFRLEDWDAYARWYNIASKGKHLSEADKRLYNKVIVMRDDFNIINNEEAEENSDE